MRGRLNYRHHFHAGNFADVFKHAVLLVVVAAMKRGGASLRVVETHAGAGLYDLRGEAARKSKEADAGVVRLMADAGAPGGFEPLRQAIRAENVSGDVVFYPGSPLLLTAALGPSETYIGCELRSEDQVDLARLLSGRAGSVQSSAELADGYEFAANLPLWRGRTLLVIDPPFERGDEYDEIVSAAASAIRQGDALAIWAPIKDLETFDALVSRLEALKPASLLVAEVRLRPLTDPIKMNGCAMLLIDAPDVRAEIVPLAEWVATHCGEPGGTSRVAAA